MQGRFHQNNKNNKVLNPTTKRLLDNQLKLQTLLYSIQNNKKQMDVKENQLKTLAEETKHG